MLLSLLSSRWVAAQPSESRLDFASLYQPVANRLLVETRREADSLRLLLNRPAGPAGQALPTVRLTVWASYEARQPLWQGTQRLRLYPGADPASAVLVLTAALPLAQAPAGAVLQASLDQPALTNQPSGSTQNPATTAWVRLTTERLARPFVLLDSMGLVLTRPYVRSGEAVAIASFGLGQPVRWRRYAASSTAAPPPFADPRRQPAAPRTLGVLDSSAAALPASDLLRLPQQGLYALRVGGTGGEPVRTVPLLVVPSDFPGQRTAPELIEPLLYLTTAAERQQLQQAADPKRAVDQFWLASAGGDQARGRDYIRRYYGLVTIANELFTGHKAGWLTDRGLLYVVLGAPSSVRRLGTGDERWIYDALDRTGRPTSFTFRPRPSTLAPDNYELVRRPEYQTLWYAAVERWRKTLTAR
ncbi:GWxTD domain-containing protein [Hymenobacter setariae]|uniref:GWxTD domain-containing protein n=1 Tax=Hymenobacter setariae TaxID=2594794 RepID=A0A558BVK7_9BACT|nr:GWxTD domain-containing protein [Hymenobacter setariae]TVT40544.1 GWxTD domain-containing protein [Hymenobacter setariae]